MPSEVVVTDEMVKLALDRFWEDVFESNPDSMRAALAAALPLALASARAEGKHWRCFHCDEVFTDVAAARAHFGDLHFIGHAITDPACQISLEAFREMEHDLQRYRHEDSDKDREMSGMQADHYQALKREEEKGYASGLRDGRAEGKREGMKLAAKIAEAAGDKFRNRSTQTINALAVSSYSGAAQASDIVAQAIRTAGDGV